VVYVLQNMVIEFLGIPPDGSQWLQYQYAGITYIIFLVFFLALVISIITLALSIVKRG